MTAFTTIQESIEEIRQGRILIVVDDEDRENGVTRSAAITRSPPEAVNFMAKHGRGLICVPMLGERLDELKISMMVTRQIWIANVEVTPLPGNLMFESPAAGGFVNAIAYASSTEEFASKLTRSLRDYGVRLKATEWLRPLTDVLASKETEARLFEQALLLKDDEVRYGTLHTMLVTMKDTAPHRGQKSSAELTRHIETFCRAFIRKEFRARWIYGLLDRPDKGRTELHKFHLHHDPRYCHIANPADLSADRLRAEYRVDRAVIFTSRMRVPQVLPVEQALSSPW